MNIGTIIDKINIKDLPDMITSYLHEYSIKELSNLRGYYSRLLEFINDDVKDSYLNRILKYLSSNNSSVINIIEDFNENIYDKELLEFSKYLVNIINKTENYQNFYEILNRNVNFIFFENNKDYCEVKTFHNNKDYDMFLFSLIKHSFKTYQINLPGIMGNRLLDEALTAYYDTEYRKRIIRASAELGNEIAINLHAAHIYKEDKDKSMKVLLKNKHKASELWQIAFELEFNTLSKETFNLIKKELKNVIEENDFINKITVTEKGKEETYDMALLYAFKIYYHIANKFKFSKAYNSLGKLMIFDMVSYNNDRKKTIELAKDFLKKAIRMGNINSATNLSIYYYNHKEDNEFDYLTMKRLFEVSATLGDIEASCFYGKLLIEEGNFNDGVINLKYAAERKYGLACLELGKYYELTSEYDLAIEYYKKAVIYHMYDASYYLSLLYLKQNSTTLNDKIPDDNIFYYLELYKDKLSDDIKIKAEKLLNN